AQRGRIDCRDRVLPLEDWKLPLHLRRASVEQPLGKRFALGERLVDLANRPVIDAVTVANIGAGRIPARVFTEAQEVVVSMTEENLAALVSVVSNGLVEGVLVWSVIRALAGPQDDVVIQELVGVSPQRVGCDREVAAAGKAIRA